MDPEQRSLTLVYIDLRAKKRHCYDIVFLPEVIARLTTERRKIVPFSVEHGCKSRRNLDPRISRQHRIVGIDRCCFL